MALTDRRKTAKNLLDSRKSWKILTFSRKRAKILADNSKSHHPMETLVERGNIEYGTSLKWTLSIHLRLLINFSSKVFFYFPYFALNSSQCGNLYW